MTCICNFFFDLAWSVHEFYDLAWSVHEFFLAGSNSGRDCTELPEPPPQKDKKRLIVVVFSRFWSSDPGSNSCPLLEMLVPCH